MGGNQSAWRHGDINKVETVGASYITAIEGEKLSYDGVDASNKMAEDDLDAMEEYKDLIHSVGDQERVDPAVIAGIMSRESRAGKAIRKTGGWGDYNNGFGLMQVDKLGGRRELKGKWNSEEHLVQATGILIYFIEKIGKKFPFPEWNEEQQLKGGLAAYNQGDGNVFRYKKNPGHGCQSVDDSYTGEIDWDHSYAHVDSNTTGQDYSNDVVARAQWYKEHGY